MKIILEILDKKSSLSYKELFNEFKIISEKNNRKISEGKFQEILEILENKKKIINNLGIYNKI